MLHETNIKTKIGEKTYLWNRFALWWWFSILCLSVSTGPTAISGSHISLRAPRRGARGGGVWQSCARGVVVVIIAHLEWGSSSSSNTRLFWAEPNIKHIYINKKPCLGMGGAQVIAVLVQAKPGTGSPKSWPTAMSLRQVRRLIRPGTERWRQGVLL